MEEGGEQKPMKLKKIKPKQAPEVSLEEIKRQAAYNVSPRAQGNSTAKPSTPRFNCLCAPTTHAGSFRCRHHRLGWLPRGGSVGSNLSMMAASKSGRFSDSLKAQ